MELPEIEKQLKELGAALVTAREDLKAAKDAPRATPEDVKAIREEIAALKKSYDDLQAKLQTAATKATDEGYPGFGFFRWKT